MPTGWAPGVAQRILEAARGGAVFQITAHHIQLHNGDPGADGTLNVLNNGTRAAATISAATAAGEMVTNVALTYTNWQSGTTAPTHFSDWSAAAGGTFQASGTISLTGAPAQGATVTIAAGAIRYKQPAAS